ncbi:hypothetical protein NDU88_003213 [Pleurodeles waltl]|uniref:Uncharacterized protein n=1 Tax=Pleurodeles waltl TaxID=8319 RepID=A0AAV7M3B9_PLEWA|nr:hypothetical protein NDU88_003213 [Pleurodeles waltl]
MLLGLAGSPATPLLSGSKEKGGTSPAPGLPSVLGHGSVPRPPLPPVPGESGHYSRGRQPRCQLLDASSGGGRGSEGRGRRASSRRTPGGAPLRRGPVRHSRPRLVLLLQASGWSSALPTVKGRALLLITGRPPPIASDPSHVLQRRSGDPVRPRDHHPRPAARHLAELGT